jgi:hypothetical protein
MSNARSGETGWPAGDDLARRLAEVSALLGSARLSPADTSRYGQRLAAICDAMKQPGADPARCARRLDLLRAQLSETGLS